MQAASGLGLVSSGALGNVEFYNSSYINTDNSALYVAGSSGGMVFDRFLDSTIATQGDGSQIRVFNFGSLTVDMYISLTLIGSLPAALVASGDITIQGVVAVKSNPLAGGLHGESAPRRERRPARQRERPLGRLLRLQHGIGRWRRRQGLGRAAGQ